VTASSSVVLLDSSVLVAALVEDESHHEASLRLLARKTACVWSHALAETFATLTGGKLGLRVPPALAAELIRQSLVPRVKAIDLSTRELLSALDKTAAAGVRGGALYDFLHLAVAQKAKASVLYTLNVRHFTALSRSGALSIELPP
jgi:predicted nucleic acid-binding protein